MVCDFVQRPLPVARAIRAEYCHVIDYLKREDVLVQVLLFDILSADWASRLISIINPLVDAAATESMLARRLHRVIVDLLAYRADEVLWDVRYVHESSFDRQF